MSHNKREWTEDEVTNLIQLYEEHEFLWNVEHKLYRNRDKKKRTFDEFASKFKNCDGVEVRRKIHNLRNQVSHEVQKMTKLKNGDGEEDRYQSKWKFFSALQFIIPSLTPSKTTSNIDITDILNKQTATSRPIKRKITFKKQPQTQEDDIIKEALQIMRQTKDDYDRFGEYVAMELKNLKSDYYRGQLKSVIRKAIVEYSDQDERTYWTGVPSSSNSSAAPSPSAASSPVDNKFLPPSSAHSQTQTAQDFYNSFHLASVNMQNV